MGRPSTVRFLAGVSAVALSGTALNASAQEPVTLEEVVVTANKRVERLQDVPSSVTALSADHLAETELVKIEDYAARVPGLSVNNLTAGGLQNSVSLRGVTTGPLGNPTVGVFVDDTPLTSSTGTAMPDLDPAYLDRIEVLRGRRGRSTAAEAWAASLLVVRNNSITRRRARGNTRDAATDDRCSSDGKDVAKMAADGLRGSRRIRNVRSQRHVRARRCNAGPKGEGVYASELLTAEFLKKCYRGRETRFSLRLM